MPYSIVLKNPMLVKVVTNVLWLISDRVFALINSLFVGALVARYLGPTQYGSLQYVASLIWLLMPFTQLIHDNVVVREIIRQPNRKAEILGTSFFIKLAAGLLLYLSVAATTLFSTQNEDVKRWLLLILSANLVFQPSNVVSLWFESQVKSKYLVWSRNTALIIVSIVKLSLVFVRAPLLFFGIAGALQTLLVSLGLIIFFVRQGETLKSWRFDRAVARLLMKSSWPLLLTAIITAILDKSDRVLLQRISGDAEVGIYSVAVFVTETWYVLPMAVATSVFPFLLHSRETGTAQTHAKHTQLFFDVMISIGTVVAVGLMLVASPVIHIVFGAQYAAAKPAATVYALSMLLSFISYAQARWLITENMERFLLIAKIVGVGINLVFNLFFIPHYGSLGAAWATVISYAASSYLICAFWPPARPAFSQMSRSFFALFRMKQILSDISGLSTKNEAI